MARPKETSDSLSHPIVEAPHIVVPPSRRTAGDYVALGVATCGVGFVPLAPGTWGAAVGVGCFLLFDAFSRAALPLRPPLVEKAVESVGEVDPLLFVTARAHQWRTSALLILIVAVVLLGVWAATRAESLLKRKDPGGVVIDEVAGQLITFLFVPVGAAWWIILAGFLAFRLFDIWKPYPINRLEALESGLGVMADDVLAGAYAATLMALLTAGYLLLN